MHTLNLSIEQLKEEPKACNGCVRYSHPGFSRRLPQGVIPCDYDKDEKLIELEFKSGERNWYSISTFFGKSLSEAKEIFVKYPSGAGDQLSVAEIAVEKIKRSYYIRVIFESDLPF